MNKMREQFEAQCDKDGYRTELGPNGTDYLSSHTQVAWEWWQAALASVSAGQEKPVAWVIYAELDGKMIPQYPAYFDKARADHEAKLFGQNKTEVRPLFAHPAPAAPQQCAELPDHPIAACWTDEEERVIREYGKACAEAARQAPAVAVDDVKKALEGMLKWFGKYPEFVPSVTHLQEVKSAIESAKVILAASTQGDKQ